MSSTDPNNSLPSQVEIDAMVRRRRPQSQSEEYAKANTTYILDKLRKFEESQNATDGAMMRRISLLENDLRGLMAKHEALVTFVYKRGGDK